MIDYNEHSSGIDRDLADKLLNLEITPSSIFTPELIPIEALKEFLEIHKEWRGLNYN